MVVIVPFLLVALLLPFVAVGDRVVVFGRADGVEGLWGAWNVAAKASLGAATSLTLAATTEVPQLLRGLERLQGPVRPDADRRVHGPLPRGGPRRGARQRTAMLARGYDPRWLWQARPIAASAGALFIRSYERGERVHGAMLARGYDGAMPPPLVERPTTRREWLLAALLPLTVGDHGGARLRPATTGAG
jgi:cobalt/nickel transport system permease protein